MVPPLEDQILELCRRWKETQGSSDEQIDDEINAALKRWRAGER